MLRNKTFWIILIAALVVAGGGYVAYATWFAPKASAEGETVLQTATVTTGDLSITANGTGMLVASSEMALAFSTAGTLEGLLVEVGDRVQAGDVLAWIDDADASQAVAEAQMQVLQAEQALALAQAQAELAANQARANLDAAQDELDDVLNWEPDEEQIEMARAELTSAQVAYQNALARSGVDQTASSRISLEQAIAHLSDAQTSYAEAMNPERDWERNIQETRERAADALLKAQQSLEVAQASYDLSRINATTADVQSARAKVLSAQSALEALESPPDAAQVTAAQIKVQQMTLALAQAELDLADVGEGKSVAAREAEIALEQARSKLRAAEETLEGTTLVAPFAGTVTAVNAEVGESVNGTVIVLADLDAPVVQFWVEEADLGNVAVGHPVRVVFEALPDLTYEGKITRVDPVLVSVGNTPAVQAWASLDTGAHAVTLLGDMNVEVEIVAGEARNALLVPVQALRKLGEGQYSVFVVQPGGELEMRVVEVGLMDFVNAEVLAGLERGEVVSTGETVAASGSEDAGPAAVPGFFAPGMGRP